MWFFISIQITEFHKWKFEVEKVSFSVPRQLRMYFHSPNKMLSSNWNLHIFILKYHQCLIKMQHNYELICSSKVAAWVWMSLNASSVTMELPCRKNNWGRLQLYRTQRLPSENEIFDTKPHHKKNWLAKICSYWKCPSGLIYFMAPFI